MSASFPLFFSLFSPYFSSSPFFPFLPSILFSSLPNPDYCSPALSWHHHVLPANGGSVEGNLPLVPLRDADQMVRIPEVQFREDEKEEGGPLQKLERCSHQGKGVPVLNRDVIEGTVVNTGTHPSCRTGTGCRLRHRLMTDGWGLRRVPHSGTSLLPWSPDGTGRTDDPLEVNGAVIQPMRGKTSGSGLAEDLTEWNCGLSDVADPLAVERVSH